MDTRVMFLDCPAYMDEQGTARCGLPAAVQYRYMVTSTDGPLESDTAALRPVRIGFTAMLSGRLPDCAGSTACRPADAILRDVASATRSAIGLRAG